MSNEQTVISSQAGTQVNTSLGGNDGPRCWRYSARGEWETAPAPWGGEKANAWCCRNTGRIVFTSWRADDLADDVKPTVDVYEVRNRDLSDPASFLVGCLKGVLADDAQPPAAEMYFVLDAPALPRLIAECGPLLNHHPILTADAHRQQAERERESRLRLATLPHGRRTR